MNTKQSDVSASRWWQITDPTQDEVLAPFYLGDEPLDEAGMIADNIEATFGASRHFSDDETHRLIFERELPNSVRPYGDAAAELLEAVDDLWELVSRIYQEKWGRPLASFERRLIGNHAISILRGKSEGDIVSTTGPTAP